MAIIILTAAVFSLFSCAPAEKADALELLKREATLKIEGERNGIAFSAELILGAEDADGLRHGEMVFTTPASFRGLRVAGDSGVWEAELDGVTLSGDAAEALGAPMAVFMKNKNAVSAERTESADGNMQTRITVENDGGGIEFTIDSKSGLPILVREQNDAGETVMKFRISEYIVRKED